MLLSDLIDLIKKGNSKFISANIIDDINIVNAASLEDAKSNEISFLEENNILRENLGQTKVSAIITTNNTEILNSLKFLKISNIVVENPRVAFAEVLNFLYKKISFKPGIDNSAVIDQTSKVGQNCYIGPNVYIGPNTTIGDNNHILPGTSKTC